MKKLKTNRGGSWINVAENCRAALHDANHLGYRSAFYGFRLVAKKPNTDRSLRGGSYLNHMLYCRSAYRYCIRLDYRIVNFGFRLVAPN